MNFSLAKCRPKMNFPILAWFIMLFQKMLPWKKDSFSHMAIIYLSETGMMQVIDATGKGVRNRTILNFIKDYEIIEEISFSSKMERKDFLKWYESIEGLPYDHSQIWGLTLRSLGLLTLNTFGHNYKKMICNEVFISLVEYAYGIDLGDSDNYDLIQTWELANGKILDACRNKRKN